MVAELPQVSGVFVEARGRFALEADRVRDQLGNVARQLVSHRGSSGPVVTARLHASGVPGEAASVTNALVSRR
jgi:hypothetical protein